MNFDAHLDAWATYFGAPVTHGTPFRRASEEGLIDMQASLHVGIRGPLYSRDDLRDDSRLGFAIIASHEIESEGLKSAIDRMLKRLRDRPVYVSVDIDVLDPAHTPGTGTPEAGGPRSRTADWSRGLARGVRDHFRHDAGRVIDARRVETVNRRM